MEPTVNDGDRVERLQTANADLERTNRELQSFTYLVTHDLKTPLQVISGFLDLLEDRSGAQLDERSAFYLAEARRGASRMELLIDELLSSALAPSVDETKESVDLSSLFSEALVDNFPAQTSDYASVTIDPLPTVVGNPMMLRRLFVNLVSNAIKFHRPDTTAVIRIDATGGSDECTIRVTDNGIGVPEDKRDAVFAMYRRLDKAVSGSGVGLAICQRIVQAHRGRIWIEDGDDGGARVCFTLPT